MTNIQIIQNVSWKDRPTIQAAHDMLEVLEPGQVDDIEVTIAAMQDDEIPYRMHVAKDGDKVVALHMCGVCQMPGNEQLGVNMNAYAAKLPSYHPRLLLRLDEVAVIQAILDADARGLTLTSGTGEANRQVEGLANKMGFKRIFIGQPNGSLKELEYDQLPLANRFNRKTGKPMRGEKRIPEHFMMAFYSANKNDLEFVFPSLKAVVDWSHMPESDYFYDNPVAIKTHADYIANALDGYRQQLEAGPVVFLTADDVAKRRATGTIVHEYTEADGD